MDHLVKPTSNLHPNFTIPFLEPLEVRQDGLTVLEFFRSQGFEGEDLLLDSMCQFRSEGILLCMQQRCYFGLLIEVFAISEVNVDVSDFVVRHSSGQATISTSYLNHYLGIWETRSENSDPKSHFEKGKQIADMIDECTSFLDEFVFQGNTHDISSLTYSGQIQSHHPIPISILIIFACQVLFEALSIANKNLYGVASRYTQRHLSFLDKLLLKAGWCTNEIWTLHQTSNLAELFYLVHVNRSVLNKDHSRCSITEPSMMKNWNKNPCIADHIDSKLYATKHVVLDDAKCDCDFLSMSELPGCNVYTALGRQESPLVRIDHSSNIKVLSGKSLSSRKSGVLEWLKFAWKSYIWYTRRIYNAVLKTEFVLGPKPTLLRPYVAISHVWSDGLGNTKANSLPNCQLRWIQCLVNKLYPAEKEPVPFWIDTMSVPLDPFWRIEAIKLMNKSYREADKVLVLDSTLMSASIRRSPEELLLHIRHSNWIKRMWTLPEGAVAKELSFQFEDDAISGEDLVMWYEIIHNESGWSQQLQTQYIDLRQLLARNSIGFEDYDTRSLPESRLKKPSATLTRQWQQLQQAEAPESCDCVHELPVLVNGAISRYFGIVNVLSSRIYRADALFENSFHAFHILRKPVECFTSEHYHLGRLIQSVQWRSTSRPEDETVCLAPLLNVDVAPLLGMPYEQRMKSLLTQVQDFPIDFLFGNRRRVCEDGFRWIPLSFLQQGREVRAISGRVARRHAKGLMAELPALHLTPCFEKGPDGVLVSVEVKFTDGRDVVLEMLLRDDVSREWNEYRLQDLAILLEPSSLDEEWTDAAMSKARSAILVSLYGRDGDACLARIECNVVVGPPDKHHDTARLWAYAQPIEGSKWIVG